VNKIDAHDRDHSPDGWECFTRRRGFAHVLAVSALEGRNLDLLVETLFDLLPPGPPIFDDDRLVDCTERFLAAEVIREKVLERTEQEVPHSVAVVVEEFRSPDEYPERRNLLVRATLFVEKPGQKAILIGKGGAKLKDIGGLARRELEEVFGYDVYLGFRVRCLPGPLGQGQAGVEELRKGAPENGLYLEGTPSGRTNPARACSGSRGSSFEGRTPTRATGAYTSFSGAKVRSG